MALTKITTSLVAVNSLTAANIADNSIDATKIANNQILARHIPNATALTLDGGLTVDNITIDGTEIDLSSGDLTVDVAGDIILDADGGDIKLQDGGTEKMRLSGNNLHLNGGTDARIQLNSAGAGANSTSNDTVHIRGDGESMKLMAAADGHYIFEIDGSEKMRLTSAGKLGLGTTSPTYNMRIFGSGNTFLQISQSGDATAGHLIGRSSSKDLRIQNSENANTTFWTNNTERMRIDSSGYLYVGTTSRIISGMVNVENVGASNCFTGKVSNNDYYNFAGSNSSGSTTFYVQGDGDYYFGGTSQSDRDLKENIQPISESSLAKVKLLEPKTFNFKESEGYATNTKTGFIAQEVAEIFGTETGIASGTDGQKDMGIDTTGIVAHLTKAIQELSAELETAKARIKTLENA